jgi:hypothetical protein
MTADPHRMSLDAPAAPPPIPEQARPRRRRRLQVVAALAAVLVAAGAAGWFTYVARYQPLTPGSFTGPRGDSLRPLTDGVHARTGFVLVGPRGTTGTLMYSVRNGGRFAVRLLGLPDGIRDVTVRWAPTFRPEGDGPAGGTPSEVRPLPVTVHPGHEVTLWITVTQPHCIKDGEYDLLGLPLVWSALGRHHTYQLALTAAPEPMGVTLCLPAAQLRKAHFEY